MFLNRYFRRFPLFLSRQTTKLLYQKERIDFCKETIASGDFEAIVNLIRMLHFHEKEQNSKGRHLHISDERFLREAEKMACDEIEYALNIERSEIMPMLLK